MSTDSPAVMSYPLSFGSFMYGTSAFKKPANMAHDSASTENPYEGDAENNNKGFFQKKGLRPHASALKEKYDETEISAALLCDEDGVKRIPLFSNDRDMDSCMQRVQNAINVNTLRKLKSCGSSCYIVPLHNDEELFDVSDPQTAEFLEKFTPKTSFFTLRKQSAGTAKENGISNSQSHFLNHNNQQLRENHDQKSGKEVPFPKNKLVSVVAPIELNKNIVVDDDCATPTLSGSFLQSAIKELRKCLNTLQNEYSSISQKAPSSSLTSNILS